MIARLEDCQRRLKKKATRVSKHREQRTRSPVFVADDLGLQPDNTAEVFVENSRFSSVNNLNPRARRTTSVSLRWSIVRTVTEQF